MLQDERIGGIHIARPLQQRGRLIDMARGPLTDAGLHKLGDLLLANDGERQRVFRLCGIQLHGAQKMAFGVREFVVGEGLRAGEIGVFGLPSAARRYRLRGQAEAVLVGRRSCISRNARRSGLSAQRVAAPRKREDARPRACTAVMR